jgi:integrase
VSFARPAHPTGDAMTRGRRIRVGRGLYQDLYGLASIVHVGSRQREKRWPPGTPLDVLRAWQTSERAILRSETPPPQPRGTLQADTDRYLHQVRYLTGLDSVRAELRAWTALYGTWGRWRIGPEQVRLAIGRWTEAGTAPKTISNRVNRLARLWRVLDGRRVRTPCDDIDRPRPTKTPITAVPPLTINTVLQTLEARERQGVLRDAKTRGRFMVLASTGRRPSELMRAQPTDVDLERRVWVCRDGKGGWSPGQFLNREMIAAWRVFIEADAWGPYNTGAMARTLRAAGWPAGVKPYSLRHTLGLTLSEAGVDLADIQVVMGHRRIATTRAHYVPVLGSRLEAASRLLEGRFGWATPGTDRMAPPKRPRQSSRG